MGDETTIPTSYEVPTERPSVIYRAGWRALPAKWQVPLNHPVSTVVYTSTGTKQCHSELECENAVREIQRIHMVVNQLPDIQYNFLVGGDNRIYEGRGWDYTVQHDPDFKHLDGETIDIAYIGDYNEREPTRSMATASFLVLQYGLWKNCVTNQLQFITIRKGKEYTRFNMTLEDNDPPPLLEDNKCEDTC